MKICVLIPAYNEEEAIGSVVEAARKIVPDVVVISDGSTDETTGRARRRGAIVIEYQKNRGKGGALKVGFEYALKNNYDAVITMDADDQHMSEDMPVFISAASAPNVGIVAGNRMHNPEGMPLKRLVTNFLMSGIISLICRQKVPDTQCGYRLIKCDVLKGMKITSENYEIESELLLRARKSHLKIVSVPIKSVYAGQESLINPYVDTKRFFIMLFKVMF